MKHGNSALWGSVSILTGAPEFDPSSTEARLHLVERGADACRDMLPEPVLNYIKEHNLYPQRNGDTLT